MSEADSEWPQGAGLGIKITMFLSPYLENTAPNCEGTGRHVWMTVRGQERQGHLMPWHPLALQKQTHLLLH